MSKPSLTQLEREVEVARSKLAADLSTLRSPATAAEFTGTLKQEALDTKDALVEQAKTTVQTSIESLIQEAKARAAANPAAALMIGAGLAWRLVRHPPIASMLVGAGMLSLFRTAPARVNGQASGDYLSHAQNRLKEQASEATDTVKEKVSALAGSLSEQATETAADLKERAKTVGTDATAAVGRIVSSTRDWTGMADAVESIKQVSEPGLNAEQARDNLLLGAASLAVVAAFAISCEKRLSQSTKA